MPHVRVEDINIYYEIHGEGPQTLTLIRGLGSSLAAWYPQIPELSRHFRTIVFDNRGAGRTDKPDSPYTIRQMAADVVGLLDALSVPRTSMLGVSMGGMIAQEFAIHYPERLGSLILGCTSFGGPEAVALVPESWEAILGGADAGEDVRRLQERALYCDETISANRTVIAAFNEARGRFPMPRFALDRQATALLQHDASGRIAEVRVPALVITGKDDRLIPPENSHLIASRIPGSVLKELPGGHLFTCEYPDAFNRAVVEFVKEIR